MSTWRRDPKVLLPLALALGFFLWGHEGEPWLFPMLGLPFGPLSFAFGALVMAVLPALALRATGESLSDYGLGFVEPKKGLPIALVLAIGSIPVMHFVARDAAMADAYPLYAPSPTLLVYEASYLLFFVAAEVSMRGYLLFGLKRWSGSTGLALLVSTLVQVVWHLDKPLPEVWSAPVWGLAVGALCLRLGSVWYAVLFHYVSNVALDLWILAAR